MSQEFPNRPLQWREKLDDKCSLRLLYSLCTLSVWMDYKRSEVRYCFPLKCALHQLGHGSILLEWLFFEKYMDLNSDPNNSQYSVSIIVLISSHTPGHIKQHNSAWGAPADPLPPVKQLFIFVLYHLYLHDHVCVLSLFYDHKYYDHYYAGLWSCHRLGLNSSQHASVFHLPYRSALLVFVGVDVGGSVHGWLLMFASSSGHDVPFLPPLCLDIGALVGPACFNPSSQQLSLQERN